jgi:caffeoyl-CoA O-methyltransferase
MDLKFTALDEQLYAYLVAHGHNRDPVLEALAEETKRLGPAAIMQVAPEQGTLLTLLARVMGASTAIEIGTFTGYSAICIARGLRPEGKLICCDINAEYGAIACRYFAKAGLEDRIDLRIAPAVETLRALPADVRFDFAFIDADKVSYRAYYEAVLERMRPDGLIVLDNVLWMGRVADVSDDSGDTSALRALNDFLIADRRVQAVMLAVSDGITLVRKRAPDEAGF